MAAALSSRAAGGGGLALQHDLPLAVFPGGTTNHFANDICCHTAGKTVQAVGMAALSRVDVMRLNDETTMIDTFSIGAYPDFIRTRDELAGRIGKPLAAAYAMWRATPPGTRRRRGDCNAAGSTTNFTCPGSGGFQPAPGG